jgi:5'-nucleotidase
MFNIPAIALSQCCTNGHPVKWATAEQSAPDLISRVCAEAWPKDLRRHRTLPDRRAGASHGGRVTTQGKRKLGDELLERIDPRGQPYVWIGGLRSEEALQEGTDLHAVADGYISVTPVHMDMTHRESFHRLRLALK